MNEDIEYFNKYLENREFIDGRYKESNKDVLGVYYINPKHNYKDLTIFKFSKIHDLNEKDPVVDILLENRIINTYNISTCVLFIKDKRWLIVPSREDKLKRILNI